MTRALGSSWPFSAPCRAHVGSAWCRLCQDSPNDAMASQATLRDLSRTSNSSLPKVWQMELIDQVTWCSSAMRTRLPQKKAVTAAHQDIPHSPPISADSRPLLSAFQSSPYRHGECGSPSRSLYLWCLRWSETQVMTGPSMDRLPATASA